MNLCELCGKTFSKNSNLKRHEKYVHSTSRRENFICYHCSQNFRQKSNLVKHLATCKSHKKKKITKIISCCLCNEVEIPKRNILQHYNLIHGLDMTIKKLDFDSYVDFKQWKDKLETDTVSKYTRFDKSRSQTNVVYYYHCHRDGFFISRGQTMKRIKHLGSNKINGHCPARIRVSVSQETGKISVDFLPTHVGHSNTNLGKIPLKKTHRELLESPKTAEQNLILNHMSQPSNTDFGKIPLKKTQRNSNTDIEKIPLKKTQRKLLENLKTTKPNLILNHMSQPSNTDFGKIPFQKTQHKLLENPKTAEPNLILNHMSQPSHLTSEVDKRKAKILETVQSHLNSATTLEHCTVIEKALLPVGPTFLAMQSNRTASIFPASTHTPRTKRNIVLQKRELFSTKKKENRKNNKFDLPTNEEKNNNAQFLIIVSSQ